MNDLYLARTDRRPFLSGPLSSARLYRQLDEMVIGNVGVVHLSLSDTLLVTSQGVGGYTRLAPPTFSLISMSRSINGYYEDAFLENDVTYKPCFWNGMLFTKTFHRTGLYSSNVSFGESRSSSMKSDSSHHRVSTVSAGHKAAGPSTLFGVFESDPAGPRPLAPSASPHSSTQPRSNTTRWSNTESDMKHLRSLRSSSTSKTTTSKANVSKSNVNTSSKTQAINSKSSKASVSSKSSVTKNDEKDASVKSSGLTSAKSKSLNKSRTDKTVKLGDSRSSPASRLSSTRGTQTNKSERKSGKGNSKSVHTRDPHSHGARTDTTAHTKLKLGAKTDPNSTDSKAQKTDVDNKNCPRVRYGETTKKGDRSVTAIHNFQLEDLSPVSLEKTFRTELNLPESNHDYSAPVILEDDTNEFRAKSEAHVTVTSDLLPTQRRTSASQLLDTGSVVDGSVTTTTTLGGSSLQVTTTTSTRRQTPATAASGAAEAHIVHPVSGETLTLHEAMVGELVDLTSGTLTHPTTGEKMPLSVAAERGYLNPTLLHHLETPCGIIDPATGKELTLLQATKKGLYSPEEGSFKDPTTGELLSPEKAAKLGFIILEKVSFFTELCVPVVASLTLYDAIVEGHVNVRTGEFTVPASGEKIPLTQAFAKSFISAEPAPVATSGISLSEAVNQGFIDDYSGQAVDRNSGNKYTLDEAIQKGLLAPHIREVVNSDTGCKLTVAEAIQEGVLDVTAGRYVNNVTNKKLKFSEAVQQQLICRPFTLKDCSDLKLLDNKGEIQDPQIRDHIPLLEAVGKGIVDVELKSIKDTASKTLLTLPEAFMFSVLLPEGKYRDTESGEVMSLLEAVNKGLITSVSTKTIFDIDGIKDPESGDYISFKMALHKGIIDPQTGMFTDPRTGTTMTLEEAVEAKRIQPQILETLKMNIGLVDSDGKEMNVVEAVLSGRLDPNTGQVLDPKTGNAVALEDAVRKKIITPEGAATLRGLLSVTVTTATITKTIKRYVTVKSTGVLTTESKVTLQEAQQRGLINEAQGTFQDPESGATVPLDEAIERGLVTLSTEWPTSLPVEQVTSPESPTRETTKRHLSPDKPHTPVKAARTSMSPEKEQPFKMSPTKSPERPSRRGSSEKETLEGRTSPEKREASPPKAPDRRSSPTKSSRPTSPSKSVKSSPVKELAEPELMDTKVSTTRPDMLFETQNGSKESSPVKSFPESPSKSPSSRQMSPFTLSRETSPVKSFGSRPDSPMKSSGIGPESPLKTDESMPTSPDKGLIKDQVLSPERPPRKGKSTLKSPADSVDSAMGIVDDLDMTSSGASLTGSTSAFTDSYSIKTRTLELPPDGWYLKEAIEEKLYDPVMGLFTIPGTDRLVSFEECVKIGIIDQRSAEAIDPKNGRKISLMRAIEKGVLDCTGRYPDESNTDRRLTMKEAITKKFVILIDRTEVTEQASGRVIQITSVEGQPDKVQVFDGEGEVTSSVTEIKTNEPAVDDAHVEIKPGMTFHPTEGNIHMEDGSVVDVVTAVKEGKIQPTGVKRGNEERDY
ncbi:Plectin [Portunus trituberculatus]|uniref:Plectin n=1 Tax=Portunus trituberculatus TaxID=210409 RepID=A0A5B7CHA6_PORTR|nr:Plectin [Portunus trituberculatus]